MTHFSYRSHIAHLIIPFIKTSLILIAFPIFSTSTSELDYGDQTSLQSQTTYPRVPLSPSTSSVKCKCQQVSSGEVASLSTDTIEDRSHNTEHDSASSKAIEIQIFNSNSDLRKSETQVQSDSHSVHDSSSIKKFKSFRTSQLSNSNAAVTPDFLLLGKSYGPFAGPRRRKKRAVSPKNDKVFYVYSYPVNTLDLHTQPAATTEKSQDTRSATQTLLSSSSTSGLNFHYSHKQFNSTYAEPPLQERTTDINGVERSDNVNEIIISEKITTKPSNITTATHPQLSPPSKSDSNNSSPLTSQTPTLISPTIATQIIHQFPSPVQIPSYSYQFQRKGDLLHSPWDNRITQTPVPVFDRDASQPGFFSPFLAKFIDFEVNQQESAEFLRKILFAFAIGTLIAAWIALGVALGVFPLHLLFSNEEKTRSNSELKRNVLNGSDLDELGQRVSLALDSMWLKALEDRVKKDPEGDFTVAKCCILSNLKKVDCVLVRNNKESGKVGGGPVSCASGLVYNFQFGEDDQDENDDVLT
ncbi:hypothetical protein Fcan01_05334 [Folsomia candida]|uniref:Uncharacterized protein n=2 Tax=Folsomia candida TaxID=158441 RepID=A0A226ETE8_FOLCA|nr:hypothetical protein Fcan01_05334 [Folsomia candida]